MGELWKQFIFNIVSLSRQAFYGTIWGGVEYGATVIIIIIIIGHDNVIIDELVEFSW